MPEVRNKEILLLLLSEFPGGDLHANYRRLSPNCTACLRTTSEMFAPVNSNTSGPCVVANESAMQAAVAAAPAGSATKCSSVSRCLIAPTIWCLRHEPDFIHQCANRSHALGN